MSYKYRLKKKATNRPPPLANESTLEVCAIIRRGMSSSLWAAIDWPEGETWSDFNGERYFKKLHQLCRRRLLVLFSFLKYTLDQLDRLDSTKRLNHFCVCVCVRKYNFKQMLLFFLFIPSLLFISQQKGL